MCVCVCTCVKISVSPGRWRRVPALIWKRLRHTWRQPDVLGAHKGARTSAWEQGLSSGLLQNLCLAGWGLTWVPPPLSLMFAVCVPGRAGHALGWMHIVPAPVYLCPLGGPGESSHSAGTQQLSPRTGVSLGVPAVSPPAPAGSGVLSSIGANASCCSWALRFYLC